jgi:predicted dehydrogenase
MTDLRIALLGSGYISRTYAEGITKYNNRSQLAAVAGGTRAPGLASDYDADFEPTYESLLARTDVDAVLIATPHADHVSQVIQAAEAGKHVLVEKPMATSTADCTSMIQACEQAGVHLEVIQTLRFRGAVRRARQILDEGRLGDIWMFRGHSLFTGYFTDDKPWTGLAIHGGAFLDMGVHNFDALRFLSGAEPQRVYSQGKTFGSQQHKRLSVMTQTTLDSEAIAQQWMSFEIPEPNLDRHQHRYVVVGEQGILDIDGYGKLLLGRGDDWELIWEQPPIDYVGQPMDPVRLEAFYIQTQIFTDNVLEGNPPNVSGSDGRAAVEMVEAARSSIESGQAVELRSA